jgi:plastocyanin
MPDIWIQLENRPWDICPHNIDRMTGQTIQAVEGAGSPAPASVTLKSINGGADRNVRMYKPIRSGAGDIVDALIFRRYKPPEKADGSDAWTVPDDRKVNPWDINELDPSETGTPVGPVLPGTAVVNLKNIAFNPAAVSVHIGDSVHWVWQEDTHSVTADDNSFDTGVENNGHTFDHMFMSAGTLKYHCSVHGGVNGAGMSGQVIVT